LQGIAPSAAAVNNRYCFLFLSLFFVAVIHQIRRDNERYDSLSVQTDGMVVVAPSTMDKVRLFLAFEFQILHELLSSN
jgi:hypothetical protein